MSEAIEKVYKPWLIASVAILVASLALLVGVVVAVFSVFTASVTPLWVTLLGVLAAAGVFVGFGGFLGLMVVAGYGSWRESRRVEIFPPTPRNS